MQTIITSTALAIVLFYCFYFAFKTGLKLGMDIAKGKEVEPVKTPIKVIQEIKEIKELEKKEREFQDGMKSILEYDPDAVE